MKEISQIGRVSAFQCAQNDRRAAFRSIAYFAEERVFWIVIAGSKMRRPRVNGNNRSIPSAFWIKKVYALATKQFQ